MFSNHIKKAYKTNGRRNINGLTAANINNNAPITDLNLLLSITPEIKNIIPKNASITGKTCEKIIDPGTAI